MKLFTLHYFNKETGSGDKGYRLHKQWQKHSKLNKNSIKQNIRKYYRGISKTVKYIASWVKLNK